MLKIWFFPVVLFSFYAVCEGLECYHCHTATHSAVGKDFVPCNTLNMTASNTWVCPHPNAQCVIQTVEVQALGQKQVWRTCSNGISDPCDPNSMVPGVKLIKCKACKTDRCNLHDEEEQLPFTFNINANINLVIRQ